MFSAILAAADRKTVAERRLLEVGACRRMTGYEQRTEGVQGWRDLQWLHRMKEWATFAFIACPGEIRNIDHDIEMTYKDFKLALWPLGLQSWTHTLSAIPGDHSIPS